MVYQPTNMAAANTPYFTPAQTVPAGTALTPAESTPKLFTPLTIRGSTLSNRILLAPMCTYSAENGHATDFHLQHLGSIGTRGAGMVMTEAAAVSSVGRISPEDLGLWEDSQIAPLARIATYLHSQGRHFSTQLAHSGRKASTVAPWLDRELGKSILAHRGIGGWSDAVVGASALRWSTGMALPRELSPAEIAGVVQDFAAAAVRAVKAGIDSIQIHAAHGYLIHSFLSGVSNTRTDAYGGSFENRIRILLETVDAVRAVVPESMPLMVRISATDWLPADQYPDAWSVENSIALAKLLYVRGVDLLDVSSGGSHEKQEIAPHNSYQAEIAVRIKKELLAEGGDAAKLLVSAVGGIEDGIGANKLLEDGVDAVFAGRAFLRDPGFALECARELGVKAQWPLQYLRKGEKTTQK